MCDEVDTSILLFSRKISGDKVRGMQSKLLSPME